MQSMADAARPGAGCLRRLFQGFLLLVMLVLGTLAWDVWQLRALRPPDDRTFEGFVREGRRGTFRIEAERLYWTAPPAKTLIPYPDPPVYEFDRSGALVNWTPGTQGHMGMILEVPVRPRGKAAGLDEARAWLKRQ